MSLLPCKTISLEPEGKSQNAALTSLAVNGIIFLSPFGEPRAATKLILYATAAMIYQLPADVPPLFPANAFLANAPTAPGIPPTTNPAAVPCNGWY